MNDSPAIISDESERADSDITKLSTRTPVPSTLESLTQERSMEQLKNIEQYLLRGEYPTGYTKADKANLRRKCRNFKLEEGILNYRRNV